MTVFANWVEQTTTTTGTGNLTVSSVTGRKTFHGEYSTTQPFPYVIRDADNVPLEYGIGLMSDSTTLVRQWVFEVNTSGTFSKPNSSSGQLSLAAGTKTVAVAAPAQLMMTNPPRSFVAQNATANNRILLPVNQISATTSAVALTSGRLYAFPAFYRYACSVDAFTVRATTTGNVDVGLYRMGQDGLPGALVVGVNNQAVASGMNYLTFSSTAIQPGWYALAINISTAISFWQGNLEEPYGRSDNATPLTNIFRTVAQGTLPDPYGSSPTIGNLTNNPTIGLRHV